MNRGDWHAHPMTPAERSASGWFHRGPAYTNAGYRDLPRMLEKHFAPERYAPEVDWRLMGTEYDGPEEEFHDHPEPVTGAHLAVAIAAGIITAVVAWVAFVVIIAVWGD